MRETIAEQRSSRSDARCVDRLIDLFLANRVVLAVVGRQIEPAWARQCAKDGQIEPAKAN